MIKRVQNTFDGGMNKDLEPLKTPNNVMTDCVNGTFITFNGNEFTVQQDSGNVKVGSIDDLNNATGNSVRLPDGFIPVGLKEYGGILYVVSYNPLSGDCEIGSFPSPETVITSDEDETLGSAQIKGTDFMVNSQCVFDPNSSTNYKENRTITKDLAGVNQLPIMPGDQFAIYTKNEPPVGGNACDNNVMDLVDVDGVYYDFKYIITKNDGTSEIIPKEDLVTAHDDEPNFIRYTGNSGGTISVVVTVRAMKDFNGFLTSINNPDSAQTDPAIRFYFDSTDTSDFKLTGVNLEYSVKKLSTGILNNYSISLKAADFTNGKIEGHIEGSASEFETGDLVTYKAIPLSKYRSYPDLAREGSFTLNVNEKPEGANKIWRYSVDDTGNFFQLEFDYNFNNNGMNYSGLTVEFYDMWSDISTYYTEVNPIPAPIVSPYSTSNIELVDEPSSDTFDGTTRGGVAVSELGGSDNPANYTVSKYRNGSYVRSNVKLRKNHFYLVSVRLIGQDTEGNPNVYEISGSVYTNDSFNGSLENDYHTLPYNFDKNFEFVVNGSDHSAEYADNTSPVSTTTGQGTFTGKLTGIPQMKFIADSTLGQDENTVDSAGPGTGVAHGEVIETDNNKYKFEWDIDFVHKGYGFTNQDAFRVIDAVSEKIDYTIESDEEANYSIPNEFKGVTTSNIVNTINRTNEDKGHKVKYVLSGDILSKAKSSGTSVTETRSVVRAGSQLDFAQRTPSTVTDFQHLSINAVSSEYQNNAPIDWFDQKQSVLDVFGYLPPLIGVDVGASADESRHWYIKMKIATENTKVASSDKRARLFTRNVNHGGHRKYMYLVAPPFHDYVYVRIDYTSAKKLIDMKIYGKDSDKTMWPTYISRKSIQYHSRKIIGDRQSLANGLAANNAIRTSAGTNTVSRKIKGDVSLMKTCCHFNGTPELITMDRSGREVFGFNFIEKITELSKARTVVAAIDDNHWFNESKIDLNSTTVAAHYGMYDDKSNIPVEFDIVDDTGTVLPTGYYLDLTPTQSYIDLMLASENLTLGDSSLESVGTVGAIYDHLTWPVLNKTGYDLLRDNMSGLDSIESESDLRNNVYLNDTLSLIADANNVTISDSVKASDDEIYEDKDGENYGNKHPESMFADYAQRDKTHYTSQDAIYIKYGDIFCPRHHFEEGVIVEGDTIYEANVDDPNINERSNSTDYNNLYPNHDGEPRYSIGSPWSIVLRFASPFEYRNSNHPGLDIRDGYFNGLTIQES